MKLNISYHLERGNQIEHYCNFIQPGKLIYDILVGKCGLSTVMLTTGPFS